MRCSPAPFFLAWGPGPTWIPGRQLLGGDGLGGISRSAPICPLPYSPAPGPCACRLFQPPSFLLAAPPCPPGCCSFPRSLSALIHLSSLGRLSSLPTCYLNRYQSRRSRWKNTALGTAGRKPLAPGLFLPATVEPEQRSREALQGVQVTHSSLAHTACTPTQYRFSRAAGNRNTGMRDRTHPSPILRPMGKQEPPSGWLTLGLAPRKS